VAKVCAALENAFIHCHLSKSRRRTFTLSLSAAPFRENVIKRYVFFFFYFSPYMYRKSRCETQLHSNGNVVFFFPGREAERKKKKRTEVIEGHKADDF
jgi:hypothetical protein